VPTLSARRVICFAHLPSRHRGHRYVIRLPCPQTCVRTEYCIRTRWARGTSKVALARLSPSEPAPPSMPTSTPKTPTIADQHSPPVLLHLAQRLACAPCTVKCTEHVPTNATCPPKVFRTRIRSVGAVSVFLSFVPGTLTRHMDRSCMYVGARLGLLLTCSAPFSRWHRHVGRTKARRTKRNKSTSMWLLREGRVSRPRHGQNVSRNK